MQGKADEVQFIVAVLMQLDAKKKAADSSFIERPAWVHALKCEFDAMVVQFKTGLYLENRGAFPIGQRCFDFPVLVVTYSGFFVFCAEAAKERNWRGNASAQLLGLNYSSDMGAPNIISMRYCQGQPDLRRH